MLDVVDTILNNAAPVPLELRATTSPTLKLFIEPVNTIPIEGNPSVSLQQSVTSYHDIGRVFVGVTVGVGVILVVIVGVTVIDGVAVTDGVVVIEGVTEGVTDGHGLHC